MAFNSLYVGAGGIVVSIRRMSGAVISTDRWPLAISGVGVLLCGILGLERVLLLTDVVSFPVLYEAGVLTSLPFILGLLYGGYWLSNSDLDPERYPRIAGWLVAVLVVFSLLINGIIFTMDRNTWHLSATRWAASIGGCVGLIMGILDAYKIQSQDKTDRVRRQNRTLERHRSLQSTLQNVIVKLSNRDRLEETVCAELADERQQLVCCCELAGGEVTIRTAAGSLADDTSALRALTAEPSPVAETLRHREQTVVHEIADVDAPWATAVRQAGIESLLVLPLSHSGVCYGALVVCATDQSAIRTSEQQVITDIAQSLAYAIHSIEQQAVLRSDHPVRVTVQVWDDDSYLCRLAARDSLGSETRLSIVETGPVTPETVTHYISVERAAGDALDDIGSQLTAVEGVRSVESSAATESAAGVIGRARVERPTMTDEIVECGGSVQTITVGDGEVEIVAEFAADTVLSDVLARLRSRLDTVRLVSKTQTVPGESDRHHEFSDLLTEKQREAIEVAYLNGFFDRPQGKTAEEIADILGISRSTFLSHVRTAEATLLGEYVTGSEGPESAPKARSHQ